MKMKVMAFALAALAACARDADIVPLNDVAREAGIPTLSLRLYGTGYGPATFTMPDGEILNGHYHLSLGGAVTTATGTASGPRGTTVVTGSAVATQMQGPFTVQATGVHGTTIVCQGSAGGVGHGDMVCTTNKDAQYQMMF